MKCPGRCACREKNLNCRDFKLSSRFQSCITQNKFKVQLRNTNPLEDHLRKCTKNKLKLVRAIIKPLFKFLPQALQIKEGNVFPASVIRVFISSISLGNRKTHFSLIDALADQKPMSVRSGDMEGGGNILKQPDQSLE